MASRSAGRQRSGVADAGRAAIADEVEAERVEILLQAGLVEIVGDDLRARRERGFHPRLDVVRRLATALRASRPAATRTFGLEVLVQLVIAAITTSPWPIVNRLRRPSRAWRGCAALSSDGWT